MVSNPLSVLWVGRCNIYEYQKVTDSETYQTSQKLVKIVTDEPCRVSYGQSAYSRANPTDISNGAAYVDQTITLFIRPDLVIKEGSVIEVTQHNVTNKYKRTSKPAIHSQHQEVLLELYEDKA
jgi:hypothetical protein